MVEDASRHADAAKAKNPRNSNILFVRLRLTMIFSPILSVLFFPLLLNPAMTNENWGGGADIILLLDVSESSFPPKDSTNLDSYRLNLISNLVRSLKGMDGNLIGDRIAIVAFSDRSVEILPQNMLFENLGGDSASKRKIIQLLESCANGNDKTVSKLNRKRTNIKKALDFVRKKYVARERSDYEKHRRGLVLLLTDGIQDQSGTNVKGVLQDIEGIRAALNAIQDQPMGEPKTELWFFHLPHSVSNDILHYPAKAEWKALIEEKKETYSAPKTTSEMPAMVDSVFREFRLRLAHRIEIIVQSPPKLREDTIQVTFGFKTQKHPYIEKLHILIEAESLTYTLDQQEENQIQVNQPRQKIVIKMKEERIDTTLNFICKNLPASVAGGKFSLKFSIDMAGPVEKSGYFKFILLQDGEEKSISDNSSPHMAFAQFNFKKEQVTWSILTGAFWERYYIFAIFTMLVILTMLGKILTIRRYRNGGINWLWKFAIDSDNIKQQKDCDGKAIFDLQDGHSSSFILWRLGNKLICFEKQKVEARDQRDRRISNRYQTYLVTPQISQWILSSCSR